MSIKNLTLKQALPYILIIVGVIGYTAAFIIMVDKMLVLENPNYVPSCDTNPVISCGSIMQSAQAKAFGFANPLIGLGAFPVLAFVGVAILAGARFKRWFWLGLNAGLLFGIGFVHWLFFESVYRIGALCPYCMAVWAVSITGFWYVTLYNIDSKFIRLPKGRANRVYDWIRRHHIDIVVLWLLIIAALTLKRFWYYYGRNF
ncbi:Vitamin K epoxide reductase [Candidatus Saccharibacteria bacterium CG_4_10_14_0_2_um_filter_52_9]|nr:MAG: Vitamin K epoxide reductase [Candidatus Saccharibacteria bacterium CG_4_10_14_0_2_um_filter_52_9]